MRQETIHYTKQYGNRNWHRAAAAKYTTQGATLDVVVTCTVCRQTKIVSAAVAKVMRETNTTGPMEAFFEQHAETCWVGKDPTKVRELFYVRHMPASKGPL